MCNFPCLYTIQFPGLLPGDTNLTLNGVNYPPSLSVDTLVQQNPQFFYAYGLSGVKTLCTTVVNPVVDTVFLTVRIGTTVTINGVPITMHPPHAPHFG